MAAEYRAKRKGEWHLLEEYDCFGDCFIFDGFQLAGLLLPIFISSLSLFLSLFVIISPRLLPLAHAVL